jgi:hypothetical protein
MPSWQKKNRSSRAIENMKKTWILQGNCLGSCADG